MGRPRVRLLRQFDGTSGTVWREYADERGRRVVIRARAPGARSTEARARSAARAARQLGVS